MSETSEVKAYERAIILGDLSSLSESEKLSYYQAICESVGLNPLSKPFDFDVIKGKLALFANAGCAAQLRQLYSISVTDLRREFTEGLLLVTVKVQNGIGRTDMATGAVPFPATAEVNVQERAHLIMAAETKAKRRATLSICGLGMLDETEVESIRQQEKAANAALPTATVAPAINQAPAPVETSNIVSTVTLSVPVPPVPKKETVVPVLATPVAPPITRPVAPPPVSRPAAPPVVSKPATAPTPGPLPPNPNRLPARETEVRETPAELAAVADAVARDKDPVPPANPTPAQAVLDRIIPVSIAQPVDSQKPSTPAAQPVAAAQTGEVPATPKEYAEFVNARGAKIVRDKLKDVKNAGGMMKDYLLRESGRQKLQAIPATTFERLISALEKATVEEAVQILKGGK